MREEESAITEIRAAFAKRFNRHGYGFQYAVLKKCEEVAEQLQRNSAAATWLPLVSEFPVAVQGVDTKTDFILERIGRTYGRVPYCFLISECKRANPALSNWCFAQAPYVHHARSPGYEPFIVEKLDIAEGEAAAASETYSTQRA